MAYDAHDSTLPRPPQRGGLNQVHDLDADAPHRIDLLFSDQSIRMANQLVDEAQDMVPLIMQPPWTVPKASTGQDGR
jgi:hypothetical protein